MTGKYWDDTTTHYGDATRFYDEAPADFDANRLEHRFEVAWRGGMQYFAESDGRSEAIRAVGCYWRRGRQKMVNNDGQGLARYEPGRLVITLINDDGRYDPNNSSSPLYGYIGHGKLCRLGVRNAGSTSYDSDNSYKWRFTGFITDVRCHRDNDGEAFVEISIGDGWQWLQDRSCYLPVVASEALTTFYQRMLDALQWPWDTDFGSSETLPYLWSPGDDARTVMHQAAESVGGHVFINGRGAMSYRQRTNWPISVQDLHQADLLKNIQQTDAWEGVFNIVSLAYKEAPVLWSSSLRFWELSSVWGDAFTGGNFDDILFFQELAEISIPAGETLVIGGKYALDQNHHASFTYPTLAFAVLDTAPIQLAAIFGTGTGGTGIDVSEALTLEFGQGGTAHQSKITNNYGATVYSRVLAVLSDVMLFPVIEPTELTVDRSADAGSKEFNVESPYLIQATPLTVAALKIIAEYYADLVTAAGSLPIISLEGQPDKQFIDVMDWLYLELPKLGVQNDYYAGMVEERWLTPNGQGVLTTVRTEPEVVAIYGFRLLENGNLRLLENGDQRVLE
jgi:hypothetical protein